MIFRKCTFAELSPVLVQSRSKKMNDHSIFNFWSANLLSILQPNLDDLSAESAFLVAVADVMRAITASLMWQPSAFNPLVCLSYAEYEVSKANEKDTAKDFGLNISV